MHLETFHAKDITNIIIFYMGVDEVSVFRIVLPFIRVLPVKRMVWWDVNVLRAISPTTSL